MRKGLSPGPAKTSTNDLFWQRNLRKLFQMRRVGREIGTSNMQSYPPLPASPPPPPFAPTQSPAISFTMKISHIAALLLAPLVLATAAGEAPRKRRATLEMRQSRSVTRQAVTTLDTRDLFDLASDEIAINMNGMTKVFARAPARDATYPDEGVGRVPSQPSWKGSEGAMITPPPRPRRWTRQRKLGQDR